MSQLYWSDREGMRVMRANLDGSEIETLVDTSLGDSGDSGVGGLVWLWLLGEGDVEQAERFGLDGVAVGEPRKGVGAVADS